MVKTRTFRAILVRAHREVVTYQPLALAGQQFPICKIETAVDLPPELEKVGGGDPVWQSV